LLHSHLTPDQQVLTSSLGPDYASYFVEFERIPFAAASIGQVHRARLSAAASPTGKEEAVAVKIQFPNVASSIKSDLGYIKLLLTGSKILPKGLFLDRTIQVLFFFLSQIERDLKYLYCKGFRYGARGRMQLLARGIVSSSVW
jgi:predicted unusual protein kinase regulating ubiquinone biosynthesis (AarF/ABC1/UbiB family)